MRNETLIAGIALLLAQLPATATGQDNPGGDMALAESHLMDQYNVVWTSQSKNAGESMPCSLSLIHISEPTRPY